MIIQSDIDRLKQQLRAILLNKPIGENMLIESEELSEVQEAIKYLSSCIQESNRFLGDLCEGKLNSDPPGRHNFIAGNLKELHSILNHLTWQTSQIANGDYSQKVRFLGEFSDSFNIMTEQLKEREVRLTEHSDAIAKTMKLLTSVVDTLKDWVIVIEKKENKVLYTNMAAKRLFYDSEKQILVKQSNAELLDFLISRDIKEEEIEEYNYTGKNKVVTVRSFPMDWNGRRAIVHYIADITEIYEEREILQHMAYKDTLTGCYNRRFCVERINTFIDEEIDFSMALIDLDGLKYVNDTFGHNDGDDYIKSVVSVIQNSSRTEDCLCRIGGDEFILLLPMCNSEVGERKLSNISKVLDAENKPYPMKISYGVIRVEAGQSRIPDDLFAEADIKMYQMKKGHYEET